MIHMIVELGVRGSVDARNCLSGKDPGDCDIRRTFKEGASEVQFTAWSKDLPLAACTTFAAQYGELVPHAWRGPESVHHACSLSHQRSIAMGWLDDRSAGGGLKEHMLRTPGLWEMNDAGWKHYLAAAGAD
ncbi:hypothetical protein AB0B10_25000 [Micromonospora arborensis]|uniref:hypothetical protein n=1 Tax=Micromonospora arborensis TaxID=2116518 RepID=UPI0033D172D1